MMQVDNTIPDCHNITYKYPASCNCPLKPLYLSYYKLNPGAKRALSAL